MDDARITTPFGAESTAREVIEGIDLTGKRAVVTGGSSGLGLETARALAFAGAEVTLAVRDTVAGKSAADDIAASTGSAGVRVASLDLADRASVGVFVGGWEGPQHILVNNAGIMAAPEMRTPEGWEMQFATNHLGHFSLTNGLHHALVAAGKARVVVVSSVGHLNGQVLFDDIHFQGTPMTRGPPVASRRRPTSSSRWRPTGVGPRRGSGSTPSPPDASAPT